jgi:malate synthase
MAVAAEHLGAVALQLRAPMRPGFETILTPAALDFLAALHDRFDLRRREVLAARAERQARFDGGELPDYLAQTRELRESEWRVAEIPAALLDRRVEAIGPVDRKTLIDGLNSAANVFVADLEDSTAPTWDNLLEAQINLRDAVAGTLGRSADGHDYRLGTHTAMLFVRPRAWHLPENHLLAAGTPLAGALVDFGLFIFHNGKLLHDRGRAPCLSLPKLQSHAEAQLWDEVIEFAERALELRVGAIKVTALIETLPAVFEMDEILHALRRRAVALSCGPWDYLFSYIKTLHAHRDRILPERAGIDGATPMLQQYSAAMIRVCHRRGAHAIGGLATQIPIGGDATATAAALARLRRDVGQCIDAGHDGLCVAHLGLIPLVREVVEAHRAAPTPAAGALVTREELIAPPHGAITRAGFLGSIDLCVRYLAAWLAGLGCVPIRQRQENVAAAEIARVQLWQWLHSDAATLDDGTPIDFLLFDAAIQRVGERLPRGGLPGQENVTRAAWLLAELTHSRTLAEFLTVPAYAHLP